METELVVLWYKIFQIIICSITNCSASYHDKRRGMITKKCASVQIICWSDFHSIWFGNISRGTVGFAASVSVYPGQVVYFLFSCSQHDVSPLQCLQLVIKNSPCCMSVKFNGHLSDVLMTQFYVFHDEYCCPSQVSKVGKNIEYFLGEPCRARYFAMRNFAQSMR